MKFMKLSFILCNFVELHEVCEFVMLKSAELLGAFHFRLTSVKTTLLISNVFAERQKC